MKTLITRKQSIRSMALVLAAAVMTTAASAGTDTTFDSFTTNVSAWLDGSLGILIGLAGVLVAVGAAMKSNWAGVGAGVVVAMIASFGPDVMTSMFTAVI